ncbi:choice-of-anchor H family protein [Shewanella sp. YIC-542]|uniref:choice-of-anchor H family protein n=1 Tax=Shewanella mytili TaxID=3377111 RepID=UPI00398EFD02
MATRLVPEEAMQMYNTTMYKLIPVKLCRIIPLALLLLWSGVGYGATSKSVEAPLTRNADETQLRQAAAKQLQQGGRVQNLLKTREQVIAEKTAANSPDGMIKPSLRIASPTAHSYYHQFSFYDVTTYLLDDNNYDGFYHSFSVNIDADVYGASAAASVPVYAELYLSRNGGDWMHFYSTEVFYLQGNSTYDSYQVSTALQSGYPTDHYDVLIDLYEVGYNDIVATVSSDELNSLYALPLQSQDRDGYDTDGAAITVSGGSVSVLALAGLLLLAWRRGKSGAGAKW